MTRAIRTAIEKIGESDRELGLVLDTTVRTGTTCSYNPDPRFPVRWQFEPETHEARKRRLTAILSADATGYSRMMAEDEAATITAIKAARELIAERVSHHHGRVVDASGDNILAEFPSASQAVQCAVEIQGEFVKRDRDVSPSRRMEFRIGIHLGEVIDEEGRIYGDTVNIAARLEALAAPGGICISGSVYEQVRGKLEVECDDLGEQQVKNIPRAVRVLQVRIHATSRPTEVVTPSRRPLVLGAALSTLALALVVAAYVYVGRNPSIASRPWTLRAAESAKATIAVLPFTNLSASKDDEYFSDGMTDEIMGQLSKISGLRVAARTSSFVFKGRNEDAKKIAELLRVRNLLEGSVRRSADKVRIEVQLVDAGNGFTRWSETYDEDSADVFAIQSDVAERVAGMLKVTLLPDEKKRVEKKPTQNLEAYNLYLQGRYYNSQMTEAGWRKAAEFFNRAIEKDPGFALAYAYLADAYTGQSDMYLAPRDAMPRVRAAMTRALSLDPSLVEPHRTMAFFVYYCFDWNWAAAEREFRYVLDVAPDDAATHGLYSWFLSAMGRHAEAIKEAERAHELDPLDVFTTFNIGRAYLLAGKYDLALQYLNQAVAMAPDYPFALESRGQALFCKGDICGARRDAERLVTVNDAPAYLGGLAGIYAYTGRKTEAEKIIGQLKELSKHRYVNSAIFPPIYFALGDKDQAFEWYEKAYQERTLWLTWLNTAPNCDPLGVRADPRYAVLVKKVGLPQPPTP